MKVISSDAVGSLIQDGATVFIGGLALSGLPEAVLQGIERHFLKHGAPRNLTTWACGAIGNSGEAGMKHFAHPGMTKRVVAGHFGQTGKEMMRMVFDGEVDAYNFPQGSISHLTREVGGRSPGLLTKVGLGTFVDPRLEGGKMNKRSTEDLVRLVEFGGEEWLFYSAPKVDVAVIRGTVADEEGNVTLDKEGMLLEQLQIAQAAKRSGGIVIVQVEQIVQAGSLHPMRVKVPAALIDYVVVSAPEQHMQSIATQYDPVFSGNVRVPLAGLEQMPLSERKVIARRAALELRANASTNLGIGIPAAIPAVAAEEGVSHLLRLSIESGVSGGVPAQLGDFGMAYNASSIIEQSAQFDWYDGGGLDISFLGLAQVDAAGNVNVSKFNGRPVGCGGFINITRSTPNLVFCGTFTAGGLEVEVDGGRLSIRTEGKSRKFVEQVEQITFNGKDAALRKQNVLFVTERAVLRLGPQGLELIEVAPGIDIERDVLAHMSVKPIMKDVKLMDAGIFQENWGGLGTSLRANK